MTNIEGRYVVPSGAVNVRPTERCSWGTFGSSAASERRLVDRTRRDDPPASSCCRRRPRPGCSSSSPGWFGREWVVLEVPALGALLHPQPACLARTRWASGLPRRSARDQHRGGLSGGPVGHGAQHRPHTDTRLGRVLVRHCRRDHRSPCDACRACRSCRLRPGRGQLAHRRRQRCVVGHHLGDVGVGDVGEPDPHRFGDTVDPDVADPGRDSGIWSQRAPRSRAP